MKKAKKWYESKTVWVNFVAAIAVVLQLVTGKEVVNAEAQSALLIIINVLLRLVTKHEINWKGDD